MKDEKFISLESLENYPAPEYNEITEHPTPEQLLFRQGVKYLTPKQRAVWEYHNYDKLTQDEIAEKMGISQQVVGRHIKASKKRLMKYCNDNKGLIQELRAAMDHDIQ